MVTDCGVSGEGSDALRYLEITTLDSTYGKKNSQIWYPLMSSERAQRGGAVVMTPSTPHLPAIRSTDFNLTTLGASYLFPTPIF
ncbi:hypothetical protein E2C01_089502 [Portunus trituberculatus]|uniref:Uncharacterized protein n=1 Tax=Portunus trituberculatus TaxID=210409 RepID=A0A5B7JMJ5_PORTR|nr:hypothetical protein [Portunus trituberculatus]